MGEQKRVLAVVLAWVREVECKALLASGRPRGNAAVHDRHDASASPSRAKPKAGCWDVAVVDAGSRIRRIEGTDELNMVQRISLHR